MLIQDTIVAAAYPISHSHMYTDCQPRDNSKLFTQCTVTKILVLFIISGL